MKIQTIIVGCLLLALIFGGCAGNSFDYLAYQQSELVIDADFTIGSVNYSGTITLGPVVDQVFANRDLSISYTAPQNLSGLTVAREDGRDYLISDMLNIPARNNELSNMLEICRLFSIENPVFRESKQLELSGVKCQYIRVCDNYGSYEIYLDNTTGLPKKIEAKLADTQITLNVKKINAPLEQATTP
ncbi:MAG: hypothetical protein GX303_04590 [Clostridiales bacterium]|nr:hypothetical protein [Clostridiales bacterium]